MMNFTPHVIVSEKKMKKVEPGPRADTLMLIRHFARTYEFEPGQKRKIVKTLLN
ncbi:MAG: hypothetical protein LBL33_06995 [Tannerella sp.]|jgi:hypothetical protein|nr:hypothetical protein [Tannerella sp.]